MAQLSAVITTSDSEFRSTITGLLRSSGLSIGLIDERHSSGTWPDLAVVDIRNGSLASVEAIERLRASWPSTAIFAVAASSEPDQILRLFLRHGLVVVAIGTGAGIAGAVAADKSLASLVFGVTVTDPATLGTVAGLLITVTLFACYVPARYATRLDPTTALRSE